MAEKQESGNACVWVKSPPFKAVAYKCVWDGGGVTRSGGGGGQAGTHSPAPMGAGRNRVNCTVGVGIINGEVYAACQAAR